MIIEIKSEVFEDSAELGKIKYLLQLCFYKNRYSLYTDYTLISGFQNFKALDPIDQELIVESFNSGIQGGSENADINICKNSDAVNFCTDEAIKFLNQPVSIILENSLNDSYFFNSTITHFDSSLEIGRHLENNWIQFDNAGGATNIRNLIDGKLNAFASWPKRNKKRYLRCFVIFDSDKTGPNKDLKEDKLACQKYLEHNEIIHHILNKREMENYLPDEVVSSIADPYLRQYLKLSSIQKDYFDIQNGLKKNRSDKNNDQELLDLFADLSDQEWIVLKTGLKVIPYDKSFKSEFPKLFNSSLVNKTNLINRLGTHTKPSEFEQIVNKTLSLL